MGANCLSHLRGLHPKGHKHSNGYFPRMGARPVIEMSIVDDAKLVPKGIPLRIYPFRDKRNNIFFYLHSRMLSHVDGLHLLSRPDGLHLLSRSTGRMGGRMGGQVPEGCEWGEFRVWSLELIK